MPPQDAAYIPTERSASPTVFQRLWAVIARAWAQLVYTCVCAILNHPTPLKYVFGVMRRLRPISVLGKTAVVTKPTDVREVLDRFDDFWLNEKLAPGMPWAPFLFSLDWRRQHDQERAMLWNGVCPSLDRACVADVAAKECVSLLAAAPLNAAGRADIDVVTGLVEPLMVRVAEAHFGIAPAGTKKEMAHIMRVLASAILIAPPKGGKRFEDLLSCTDALTKHLEAQIRAKHREMTGAAPRAVSANDILSRLVARLVAGDTPPWFDEVWIRRSLTGLVATGGATIVRASTHAIDRLLAHPAALQQARAIVRSLDAAERHANSLAAEPLATEQAKADAVRRVADVRLQLRQAIYEALRFRPMLPMLVRMIPRDTVVAKNSARARLVPGGGTLVVGAIGAMFDPEVFASPSSFRFERPLGDYVHFGHGPRKCFGHYLADIVMGEVVAALLRCEDLKRGDRFSGRVSYDGPAAKSLVVSFTLDSAVRSAA